MPDTLAVAIATKITLTDEGAVQIVVPESERADLETLLDPDNQDAKTSPWTTELHRQYRLRALLERNRVGV